MHCDAVTPSPLSLIHSNGGCVADKTFSNQFLGINNQPSRVFLKLQSIQSPTLDARHVTVMFPLSMYVSAFVFRYSTVFAYSDLIEQRKFSVTQNDQHFPAGDLLVPEPPSQVQEGLGGVEEGC